jgi:hypothetical protein
MDSPRGVKPKKKDRRLSDSDDKLERSEKSEKPSKTKGEYFIHYWRRYQAAFVMLWS